ncbi:hypothetical protein FACS189490_06600 [Clostridia bacterium]|nr:hypothetical protein FACS189490_06600 [Clostridia bacterium]
MKVPDKLDNFRQKAVADAQAQNAEMIKAIDAEYNAECEKIKRETRASIDRAIADETYKIEQEKNREIIAASTEAKKRLLSLRAKKVAELFDEVSRQAEKHTQSAEYEEKLVSDINAFVSSQVGGDIEIFVRERDLSLSERISGVTLLSSGTVEAGGFLAKIKDKNVIYDFSYDRRIKEAKNSFGDFKIN